MKQSSATSVHHTVIWIVPTMKPWRAAPWPTPWTVMMLVVHHMRSPVHWSPSVHPWQSKVGSAIRFFFQYEMKTTQDNMMSSLASCTKSIYLLKRNDFFSFFLSLHLKTLRGWWSNVIVIGRPTTEHPISVQLDSTLKSAIVRSAIRNTAIQHHPWLAELHH